MALNDSGKPFNRCQAEFPGCCTATCKDLISFPRRSQTGIHRP
jgi:hypothetical protein